MPGAPENKFHLYIHPNLREEVRDMAARYDMSMAGYIKHAVVQQLERDKKRMPQWMEPPSAS